jgi:hypothetical protein
MTQHCPLTHCAYCTYRHAAGTLTIRSTTNRRTEPICWTCAREALSYYADARERAHFVIFPS